MRPSLFLILSLLLAACDGPKSQGSPEAAVEPPSCELLHVTPANALKGAAVNPRISAIYRSPVAERCASLSLHDATGRPLPTRTVAATEQALSDGGVAGSMTIEPASGLEPSASYGIVLAGTPVATFTAGTERRGQVLAVQDVTVNVPGLPAASRIPRKDINQLADILLKGQLKAHDIPSELAAMLMPLLRLELPRIADPGAIHDAQVQRVLYRSTDASGAPVTLSGLLVLPAAAKGGAAVDLNGLPLVLGQHPSTASTDPAPSSGANFMLLPGLWAAGKGHLYVAPDLIGLGESATRPQAFVIAKDASAHTEDMLAAVREHLQQVHAAQPGPDLRVVGLSQGAFSSMAALPALSRHGTVRAVYGGAGPYNIHRTVDSALRAAAGEARDDYSAHADLARLPEYLRPMLDAMAAYQGLRYDPATTFDERGAPLPGFLADYRNGKHPALTAHLAVNSLAEGSQRHHLPLATVKLYRYSGDTLLAARNTDDMLARLRQQRPDVPHAEPGDCREHSPVVREILKHARSVSTTHLICFPFVLNDFLGEL